MVNKRILGIFLPATFISYWCLNYYQLHQLQSALITTMSNSSSGLKINWTRKIPTFNSLEVEFNYNDSNFILNMKPSYFSRTVHFSSGKDAQPYISDAVGMNYAFDEMNGKLEFNPTILTLSYNNLVIANQPFSIPSEEEDTEPETYSLSAKQETISLWYDSFDSIFNESEMPPMMLSYELKDLNVDGSFKVDHVVLNTLGSNESQTKYHLIVKNFSNIDSKLLLSLCNAGMQNLENPEHYCNEEVLNQALPFSIDMNTRIDNSILLRKPEDGHGILQILATNPMVNYQLEANLNQSRKALHLKAHSDTTVTSSERLQKLYEITDPDNTSDHTLQSESLDLEVKTNPYNFNPLHILLKLKSLYQDNSELTTMQMSLDQSKARYYAYNGTFDTPDVDKENLEKIGMIRVGHQSLIEPLSLLFGFDLEPGSIIEAYQNKGKITATE